MIVDLPDPDGPTSAVTVPGCGVEGDAVEDLLPLRRRRSGRPRRRPAPRSDARRHGPARVLVLRPLAQDLARPLEAGERLGQLGADRDDLEDGRDEEPEEDGVGEEAAQRQRPGEDLARPDEHDDGADDAEEDRRREAHDATSPVSVFRTLSRSRWTPPAKTVASRASAWYPLTTRTAAERLGEPAR